MLLMVAIKKTTRTPQIGFLDSQCVRGMMGLEANLFSQIANRIQVPPPAQRVPMVVAMVLSDQYIPQIPSEIKLTRTPSSPIICKNQRQQCQKQTSS